MEGMTSPKREVAEPNASMSALPADSPGLSDFKQVGYARIEWPQQTNCG
jgi:hypothetical protein